jgi:DNA replication protein DnaC
MNKTATLEKMQTMKMHGMVRAFRDTHGIGTKNGLTADEMVAFLVDAEWDERYNKRLLRLLKKAEFRYQARIEEIDCEPSRNVDRNKIQRFADIDWIRKAENILISGPTGSGKSFIANAVGHHACVNGFNVHYFNCIKLFSKLKISKADGTYAREIKKIKSTQLLILDDFGLSPFDRDSRLMLLEIIEDRIGLSSTIISSQIPVEKWFDIIGDQTIADAIVDRLIHSSHKINLKGSSMRKKFWKNPAT